MKIHIHRVIGFDLQFLASYLFHGSHAIQLLVDVRVAANHLDDEIADLHFFRPLKIPCKVVKEDGLTLGDRVEVLLLLETEARKSQYQNEDMS
jgi:hypothetical protein